MQKILSTMSKVLACVLFLVLLFASILWVNDVVLEKQTNRYYMLNQELGNRTEVFDVQVFGSCHAYTSFNPEQFEKEYGYSAYNMSNPGEIIPISYVRMVNEFQKRKPKIALVETWGIHPYNTYIAASMILGTYSPANLESLPLTREKMEVIRDFEGFDPWTENFPLARYKDRIVEQELYEHDFHYDFDELEKTISRNMQWSYDEMNHRFKHNGGKLNPNYPILQYEKRQADVGDEMAKIDEITMKYIDKIIQLCEESDVKLIFYRAPYLSNELELKQENSLKAYLEERSIPYYNMEQELEMDPWSDFNDEQHLSILGANKVTTFLGEKIAELLETA